MKQDYVDGKVTIGEIDEVIFKFKSGKVAKATQCEESWEQYGNVLIDPDVLDATFQALHEQGYLSN